MSSRACRSLPFLLVASFLAMGLSGCVGWGPVSPAPEAPDVPIGASWTYRYTHSATKTVDGETRNATPANAAQTLRMTVIDQGVMPDGVDAIAIRVDADGDLPHGETLRTGVHILDATTWQPIGGPWGANRWDPLCSWTTDGMETGFWPVRFPLAPGLVRNEATFVRGYQVHIGAAEHVDTPLGPFEAFPITVHPEPNSGPGVRNLDVVYWFAPAAGNIVRMEFNETSTRDDHSPPRQYQANGTFVLTEYSLLADPDRAMRVPLLAHGPTDVVIEPAPPAYVRIVADHPRFVPLDGPTRIRLALEAHGDDDDVPYDIHHADFYSLSDTDLGNVEVEWWVREGDRPVRSIGQGVHSALTTTNVTTLSLRADIALGDDIGCFDGSSRRQQAEFATLHTVHTWEGTVDVPAGSQEPLHVTELPAKSGNARVRVNWTTDANAGPGIGVTGQPTADCQDCAAEPAKAGVVDWFLHEDTPLAIRWLPGDGSLPTTSGHTVRFRIDMVPGGHNAHIGFLSPPPT